MVERFSSTYVAAGSTTDPPIHLSVIIRTLNGAEYLEQLFGSLMAQRASFNWEIVVVDNGSQDKTLELCRQYKATVVSLPRDRFISGRAANLGAQHARGQLLFFCSQHCVPVTSYFFEHAVAPFSDPMMAAVRCLPADSREQMANWYNARDIQYKSLEEQEKAETGTGWLGQYPSESCCIIRRSVWEDVALDETIEASEDKLWASEVLKKGYKVRSCAEAIFVYTRRRALRATWDYERRCLLGLYRARGYVALTWPNFFLRTIRAAALTPLAAGKYFAVNVLHDLYLVTIPWAARKRVQTGGPPEYDQSRARRWLTALKSR